MLLFERESCLSTALVFQARHNRLSSIPLYPTRSPLCHLGMIMVPTLRTPKLFEFWFTGHMEKAATQSYPGGGCLLLLLLLSAACPNGRAWAARCPPRLLW